MSQQFMEELYELFNATGIGIALFKKQDTPEFIVPEAQNMPEDGHHYIIKAKEALQQAGAPNLVTLPCCLGGGLTVLYTACAVFAGKNRAGTVVFGPFAAVQNPDNAQFPYMSVEGIAQMRLLVQKLFCPDDVCITAGEGCKNIHVLRIDSFIQNNISSAINVETLSEKLGLSKAYICRLFKKETGRTVTQHLNRLRVEKSRLLLKTTGLSKIEIALKCGFNHQSYFNRQFRRYTGLSPAEYKSMLTPG